MTSSVFPIYSHQKCCFLRFLSCTAFVIINYLYLKSCLQSLSKFYSSPTGRSSISILIKCLPNNDQTDFILNNNFEYTPNNMNFNILLIQISPAPHERLTLFSRAGKCSLSIVKVFNPKALFLRGSCEKAENASMHTQRREEAVIGNVVNLIRTKVFQKG